MSKLLVLAASTFAVASAAVGLVPQAAQAAPTAPPRQAVTAAGPVTPSDLAPQAHGSQARRGWQGGRWTRPRPTA